MHQSLLKQQGKVGTTTSKTNHGSCPTTGPHIVVVGSCFIDYIAYAERTPVPGETIHSQKFLKGFGGKGANQAVAAALLGSHVRMVSAIGGHEDGDAEAYLKNFTDFGVDTSLILRMEGESTGLAMITVDTTTGQNQIVICPNATLKFLSNTLSLNDIFPVRDKNCNNKKNILICQNEIPLETTLAVLEFAMTGERAGHYYTILNTAPALTHDDLKKVIPYLKYVSLICPNETEASIVTGIKVTDVASGMRACNAMRQLGVRDVVVTLGSMGYIVSTCAAPETIGESDDVKDPKTITKYFPATKVKRVVDTTGAGDCFVGSVAHFLLKGESLMKACEVANVCAGIAVCRKGTQSSYPRKHELPQSYTSKY